MEEVELVIKLSEKDLKSIRDTILTISEMYETTQGRVYCAIVSGIPLPKGHGRLIDADELTESTLCKTFGLRSVDIENAEGRGLCDNVKNFVTKGEE